MTKSLEQLEHRVRTVIGSGHHPLHAPVSSANASPHVLRALEKSSVSVDPGITSAAEDRLNDLVGSQRCVLVSSGTNALHLALLSMGVKEGDTVLCPAVSFVATANAILYCGANPWFVDVDEDDLAMSPQRLMEELRRFEHSGLSSREQPLRKPSAIVVVSVFGLSPKFDQLEKIAKENGVPLLVDAAGALGSEFKGKSVLRYGTAAITSFNGNKIVSSGSGGAIVSANAKILDMCEHLSRVAKVQHPYEFIHDSLGYNYRLPALNAALLLDQLENFDDILYRKRELHDRYSKAFEGTEFRLISEGANSSSNYWLNSIDCEASKITSKDACDFLIDRGIGCRPLWTPLPLLQHLRRFSGPRHFANAKKLHLSLLSLPSSYSIVSG